MSQVAPADRLVTLPDDIPPLTLGFEAIKWASMYLRHPDGPHAGQRWQFVESQARFLLHWYALREDGRWVYSHGVRRLAKGSGKARWRRCSLSSSSARLSASPGLTLTLRAAA